MKKLLLLLVAGGVGYLVYRKIEEDRQERDLWSEVTDEV